MLLRARGFTLVELLIVMAVVGILAAIAIPKFTSMQEKAFVAVVTSDLKNLASQQELYMTNRQTYASGLSDLTNYSASDDVTVSINEASVGGWAATGTHSGLAGAQCGIFYGSASATNASPATIPGSVACN
jgi:prepilin-type N-terminal cleavage/methylation domain-containing protein